MNAPQTRQRFGRFTEQYQGIFAKISYGLRYFYEQSTVYMYLRQENSKMPQKALARPVYKSHDRHELAAAKKPILACNAAAMWTVVEDKFYCRK